MRRNKEDQSERDRDLRVEGLGERHFLYRQRVILSIQNAHRLAAQGRGGHLDDGGRYEAKVVMSGEAFDASIAIGDGGGSPEETDLDGREESQDQEGGFPNKKGLSLSSNKLYSRS
jgi:hypothetical protein